MSRWSDIDDRMNALRSEIQALTAVVQSLRKQKALQLVRRAEQQLIKSQRQARHLKLPVAVLGAGQCKDQKLPYSVIKPKPRSADGRVPKPGVQAPTKP